MNKRSLFILIAIFVAFSVKAQEVEVLENYNDLVQVTSNSEKIYVINFWATWCAPCVKELPYFEQLHNEFASKNVEVVLVNLDFKNHLNSRLIPFLNDNKISSRVIQLVDGNTNEWIDLVDVNWSGAIPITVFVYADKRMSHLEEFTSYKELKDKLDSIF